MVDIFPLGFPFDLGRRSSLPQWKDEIGETFRLLPLRFPSSSTQPLLEACQFLLPDAERQFQQPQMKKTNGTLAGTVVSEQRFKVTYKFHEATGQKYQIERSGRLRHLFSSKINFLGGLQFTN